MLKDSYGNKKGVRDDAFFIDDLGVMIDELNVHQS
jgi:hypothetical protein